MFYRLCLSRCCYTECCKALERVEDMTEEWGAPPYSLWMDFVIRLTFHDPKVVFFLYFSYIYDCFENVDFPFGELNNVSVCVQMGTASWNAQKKKIIVSMPMKGKNQRTRKRCSMIYMNSPASVPL